MKDLQNRQTTVMTPEHIQLQYHTAGLGSRAAAHLLDWLFISIVLLIIFLGLLALNLILPQIMLEVILEYAMALAILAFFGLIGGYYLFFEGFKGGQTPGKRIMGIRVIQENGQTLTFLSCVMRNFFRLIDFLPSGYFVGALISFLHPKDKRLGDIVAGTIVIIEEAALQAKKRKARLKYLNKWTASLSSLHLSETQKEQLALKDWQLLVIFVDRLPTLAQEQKESYAHTIAAHFITKLNLNKDILLKPTEVQIGFLISLYQMLQSDWEI